MRSWFLVLVFAGIVGCEEQSPGVVREDEMDIVGDGGVEFLANLAPELAADCSPAGNYERALDHPCCPGLHPIELRLRVFSDDGSSICSFSPVRAFACVEGSCGDGRCEAPEAVACGCSLDCPIAED